MISTSADGARSVFATDLDGDGDTDVLSASLYDNKIAWYESDGGSPPAFTERVISTTADGAWSVFATDVDGDGDTDVLSASYYDDKIAWYENTGPRCGDGVADPDEQCDDGFTDDCGTCNVDCTGPGTGSTCGDGVLCPEFEECDRGIGCTDCLCDADFEPTAPLSLDCQPTCGNSRLDPGEECDGMNDAACPGACLSDCTCGPFCGDGSIDPGEECDDGGESATCDTDCTVAECGDGTLNVTAGEECNGGLGCTDCLCDADFEPTAPPSLDCYQPAVFSMKAVRLNPTCTAGRVGLICGGDRQCDTGPPPTFDGQCGGDITPTNTVSAEPGDIIVAEVFGSNWSPDGQRLRAYQFSIDEEGFTSGCGTILPYGWDGPPPTDVWCETDANCPAGMWCDTDWGECNPAECMSDADCPPEWPVCQVVQTCTGPNHDPKRVAFVDEFRLDELDWVFMGCEVLGAIDASAIGYRYGWLLGPGQLGCAPTYTVPKYFGTLTLVVPEDACGTFTIPLLSSPDSAMNDIDGSPIEPIKTEPLTITICGDGMVEGVEACDNGLGNSDTQPDACRTTCVLASCGDGVVDTGEECDGMDDTACPGACLNDCTCCPFCGDGACDPGEDSCNCPDDCGTPPLSEVLGATCADGTDNDCDGLTDSADLDCAGAIPTVSVWGLISLVLLLLAGSKIYFGRRRAVTA